MRDTSLIIAEVEILQDVHGRYSLNTLHKASGAKRGKEPSKWLENKNTQELIAELETQNTNSCIDVVKGGNASGIYADELLAVSYAGWISPAFQLRVNQAFLNTRDTSPSLPTLHDPAYQMLMRAVIDLDATRHAVAVLEAQQHAHTLALVEQQRQTIEALQLATHAETKASLALEDAHTMTIETFVGKNGLLTQYPASRWRGMATWLGGFCQHYNLKIVKTPTPGKHWDDENAYPVRALMAWLQYDTTRATQMHLVPKQDQATPTA